MFLEPVIHGGEAIADKQQVAYLMADISDVDTDKIKDLYEKLESLSCMIRIPSVLAVQY